MVELGQYFVAVLVWVMLGFILVSRALHWPGVKGKRAVTIFLRAVFVLAGLLGCVFLITATNLSRDDKSWFGLPKATPVVLSIECEFSHIPIHIPSGTTIHVVRMQSGILVPVGERRLPGVGVFDNVSALDGKDLDWPSSSDGRYLTGQEQRTMMTQGKGMPNPYAFKCSMENYGSITLEDVTALLWIETSDKKQRAYPVIFDPLAPQVPFQFYLVNMCSFGITLRMVQWSGVAIVRVAGEGKARQGPLNFGKRSWPSGLAPIFGPSWFVWNGVNDCQWDKNK